MWRFRLGCQIMALLVAVSNVSSVTTPEDTDNASGQGSYTLVTSSRASDPMPITGPPIKSKAQYTRTSLHVARSLDPSATETMQVRTRTGDVATLIVKRRSRKGPSDLFPPPPRANNITMLRIANKTSSSTVLSSARVPDPVDIRSTPVLVKNQPGTDTRKRQRSLMKIDSDGIPVIEGVRVPDDEDDKKHTWRNARVINGVLFPNEAESSSSSVAPTSTARPFTPSSTPASLGDASVKKLQSQTAQSPWIPTSPDGANLASPPLLTPLVASETGEEQKRRIVEYIKAVNQLEAGRAAGALRSRRLRNLEQSTSESEARVLHYQPALLYSAQSTNPSRVSFEEGVRTPVLQYAHPELGVQPAKVAPPAPKNHDRALAYFSQDIHSDRSPFLREPGLDNPQPEEPLKTSNAKRSSETFPLRSKKIHSLYPHEDSYGLTSDKYVKRFPHAASYKDYKDDYGYGAYRYNYRSGPSYYGYPNPPSQFLEDPRPFWVRLTDTIRDSMQTGMDHVTNLARPVVDPLMEASVKISQNLGFTSGGTRGAQDRVGTAVAAPSMILPALGLVAGGAALGLGAVAVGRYLDVDVMAKRSETGDDEEDLAMEHKRTLDSVLAGQQRARAMDGVVLLVDAARAEPAPAVPTGTDTTSRAQEIVVTDASGRQVTDADVVAQVVDLVNSQQKEELHKQQEQIQKQQQQYPHPLLRQRRDVSSGNQLDSVEWEEERRRLALRAAELGASTAVWSSTPCAQKVFCEVVSKEGPDAALFMEKKMATFLSMLPRLSPEVAAVHLSAVIRAVRHGDCSVFVCPLPPPFNST